MATAVIATQARILRKTPERKPRKAPRPPFSAVPTGFRAMSSPRNAPRNGPSRMPTGTKKSPTIVPTKHPAVPHRDHSNFLAPIAGTT